MAMLSRCRNPNATGFKNYGGRGVTVCSRWLDFGLFLADMGPRPSLAHTLERFHGGLGYEPGNCHWATWMEQGANRRGLTLLSFRGKTMHLSAWARRVGLSKQALRYRIEAGWPLEYALGRAPRKGGRHADKAKRPEARQQ